MIRNYIKIAFRNLWKYKGYSALNIFGLAIGITCASLIFLWIEDEVNFDGIFSNNENIYRIMEHQSYEGEWRTFGSTPAPLAPAFKEEVPGVSHIARTRESEMLFSLKDKKIIENGLYADPDLVDIFQLDFIQGNKDEVFSNINTVVISEKIAQRFFGNDKNIVDKSIKLNDAQNYMITGVFKDLPENVTLKFDWLTSFETHAKEKEWIDEWGNNTVETYITLKPNANVEAIDSKLRTFIEKRTGDAETKAFLFAMTDWHLRANFEDGKQAGGSIIYVRLFSIIAWIILIIACINFMNLATAKSGKRANEVGVRKALGAKKRSLFSQFILESMLLTTIAVILSIGLLTLILPQFNLIVDKQLALGLGKPLHLAALAFIILFCGFLAGSYPALYMASLRPVAILKGKMLKQGSTEVVRKSLVVTQFVFSVVLIIGTLLVYQQIQHVMGRQLGYNKDNLITMKIQGPMVEDFGRIKNELINTGYVENTALNSFETLSIGNNTSSPTWKGKDENADILISYRLISPEFISTAKMKIIDGRDFRPNEEANTSNTIITESLAKLMGSSSAVGKTIDFWDMKLTVVGVIEDFQYGDMYGKSDPVVFLNYPEGAQYLYIRIAGDKSTADALTAIQGVMQKNNPAYPFEYSFVDEGYQAKFKSETLVAKLSRIFAILAIFISCLGLFGLAAYTAEQRSKEIGIRKVLGADVAGIAKLLSKDFLKLVLIAIFIAVPIAWWGMHKWLQSFAYRIEITWWVFAIAGITAIGIALVTVSFQAIKAAIANPVKSLRTE